MINYSTDWNGNERRYYSARRISYYYFTGREIFQGKLSELENILIGEQRNIFNFFVIYSFLHLTLKMNLISTYFVTYFCVKDREKECILSVLYG